MATRWLEERAMERNKVAARAAGAKIT